MANVFDEQSVRFDMQQVTKTFISYLKVYMHIIYIYFSYFSRSFVSIVCEDSTLCLLKVQNGSQICSPIILDSPVASLHSISNSVMCLTSNCNLYVWQYDTASTSFNNLDKSTTSNLSENY